MNWIYAVVLLKATNGAIAILKPTRTDSDGFKLGGLQFPTPTLSLDTNAYYLKFIRLLFFRGSCTDTTLSNMASSAPALLGGSLKGKVALITGASSGIGAETARHFASLGCRLALTGRNMETLEEVTNECIRRGLEKEKILMIQADFELEADVKRTAEETIQKFNQIDVLVNNAGVFASHTVETVTLECFDKIFAVNVRAPLQLTQLLAPHLIKVNGTVVNVSSMLGKISMPGFVIYSMSKTVLDHMTRSIAEELAPHGVRVNAVNPGVIATPLFKRSFGMTDEATAQFLEGMKRIHAMRRTGTVDEVSRTIAFLASNDSSFTTGETVGTEGGCHLLVTKVQI